MGRLNNSGRTAGYDPGHPLYGTPEWAAWRNATMGREDVMWSTDGAGGAYLHDRPQWTARRTNAVKAAHEAEREFLKRGNGAVDNVSET